MVGGLTSYYNYQHKSANHARTGFNCIGGVSEVLRFAGLGLLLSQVIDDECGFHGCIDEQVTSVPHGFQRSVVRIGAVGFVVEVSFDAAQDSTQIL